MLAKARLVSFDLSRPEHVIDIPRSVLFQAAWDNLREVASPVHIERHFMDHYRFLKAAIDQGIGKLIVTGTLSEYGKTFGPVTSNTPTNPNSPYGLAKDFLHKSLRQLQKTRPYALIWARLFYLYGDGQDEHCIVPQFDKALESGAKSFNMSFGEQLLDYLPVGLAAEQLASLMDARDGVYNVCSGRPTALRLFLERRMEGQGKKIHLNLGAYPYRDEDSLAIWGADPVGVSDQPTN